MPIRIAYFVSSAIEEIPAHRLAHKRLLRSSYLGKDPSYTQASYFCMRWYCWSREIRAAISLRSCSLIV